MRVAVSALEADLESKVDARFGRAMYFVFVDTDTAAFEVVDNHENRNALQAAGTASAELVADAGAQSVITGHLGPKAFRALAAAGIPGFDGSGMTVQEAVEALSKDALERLSDGVPERKTDG